VLWHICLSPIVFLSRFLVPRLPLNPLKGKPNVRISLDSLPHAPDPSGCFPFSQGYGLTCPHRLGLPVHIAWTYLSTSSGLTCPYRLDLPVHIAWTYLSISHGLTCPYRLDLPVHIVWTYLSTSSGLTCPYRMDLPVHMVWTYLSIWFGLATPHCLDLPPRSPLHSLKEKSNTR
jgi:hypothetical protein